MTCRPDPTIEIVDATAAVALLSDASGAGGDGLAELFADLAGDLFEVEQMRRAWMVAPVVSAALLFNWWPFERERVRRLPS